MGGPLWGISAPRIPSRWNEIAQFFQKFGTDSSFADIYGCCIIPSRSELPSPKRQRLCSSQDSGHPTSARTSFWWVATASCTSSSNCPYQVLNCHALQNLSPWSLQTQHDQHHINKNTHIVETWQDILRSVKRRNPVIIVEKITKIFIDSS